ncbi:putative signal transducing protein [Mesoaciditoga sp.]
MDKDDENLVVLEFYESGIKAEIAKGFLEENGIFVQMRDSTVPYGGSAYFGQESPKELLVLKEDLQKAKKLLEEIEKKEE